MFSIRIFWRFSFNNIKFLFDLKMRIDVQIAMRNEIITSKIFQRKRIILCSYFTTWQRKKIDWKNVDDMSREFVKIHEKNQVLLKNIANSLRRFNNDDDIEIFDLSLNFEK